MAVVGARACLELLPTTRRRFLSAACCWPARAGRMSRGERGSTCRERTSRCPT